MGRAAIAIAAVRVRRQGASGSWLAAMIFYVPWRTDVMVITSLLGVWLRSIRVFCSRFRLLGGLTGPMAFYILLLCPSLPLGLGCSRFRAASWRSCLRLLPRA